MQVEPFRLQGSRKPRQSSGMVVVAVTERDGMGVPQGDAQPVRIGKQRISLPRVEKETEVLHLDPERQPVLRKKSVSGRFVVHDDGDGHAAIVADMIPVCKAQSGDSGFVFPQPEKTIIFPFRMASKKLAELSQTAYDARRRLVAPLMGFPGVDRIGSNIKLAQQNYGVHYKAIHSLFEAFHPDLIFPLMDLAVEANALGRYTIFPKDDSATVPKDAFELGDLERMEGIRIGLDSRLMGYVETMKLMSVALPGDVLKGGYVVGPFTLAALMMGADDALMTAVLDPKVLHRVCRFTTERIQEYVQLLIAAGADLICILEPSAVMLGPEQFAEFSAVYIRHVTTSFKYSGVQFVYHTCGNTMHLVDKMTRAGVNGVSLDSRDVGVDLAAVARGVPEDVVVIGNINPATTMRFGTPQDVRREVEALLAEMESYPNFILSTGCDLPQETPEANIREFMGAGRAWRRR
jgi:uroporphyrinogen decarboxylase